MSDSFKQITAGLGSAFENLERRSRATVSLTQRVRAALSGPEKEHVISAIYQDETLVVVATSAAWGTRIYYSQQQLLEKLASQGETQFTKLKVQVGKPEIDPATSTDQGAQQT